MHLGRVIGTVVATERIEGLESARFLLLQPLTGELEAKGDAVVAVDAVEMAGPGELVTYVSSREAAVALRESFVPVDHAITSIVDAVEPSERETVQP